MDLKKLGCKFLDTIEVPRKDFFISEYEQKFKPCVIKNYPLNWKAFTWTDEYVAKAIGHEYYLDYLNRETPYLREEEQGSHPTDTSIYLQDIQIYDTILRNDYTIPELFATAEYQPTEWRWLYWGPPTTGTHLHLDVDESQAWNITLKGKKLWWYFYDNDCYYAITQPGDIIYTPQNIPHAVTNLTTAMAITHNYSRKKQKNNNFVKWNSAW